jgi:Domain of unknown function (DUF932)
MLTDLAVQPMVMIFSSGRFEYHDGTSADKLTAGLYRLVCSNGMMVSDGDIDSINVATREHRAGRAGREPA